MFGLRTLISFLCMLAISRAIDPDNICYLVKDGSRIVNDANCSSFYTCTSNKAVLTQCQTGYNFNKDTQNCVIASQQPCGTSADNACQDTTGNLFVQDSTSCKGYHYCENGVRKSSGNCPGDLLFDAKTQKCNYEENVTCTVVTDENPNLICAYVQNNVFFGSASDCTAYMKCYDSKPPLRGNCNNDLVFNVQTRSCDYSTTYDCQQLNGNSSDTGVSQPTSCTEADEGNAISNANSCSSYLVCTDKVYVQKSCSLNYFYDIPSGNCTNRTQAITFENCNRCENTKSSFVNLVGDGCNGYIKCENGKEIGTSGTCKTGYYFNEVYGSCVNVDPNFNVCLNTVCDDCTDADVLNNCNSDCGAYNTCECICPKCTVDE